MMVPEKIALWMDRALCLAREAEQLDEVPVGAVLVCDNKVIAEGMNLREKNGRTLAHAELLALENYNRTSKSWRLPPNTTLFVTLEPCLMCTGALLSARLASVVYGGRDTKDAGLNRLRPWIEQGIFDQKFEYIIGGIQEDTCSQLLSQYFVRKRTSLQLDREPNQESTMANHL